jgi:hypothetical protein
VRGISVLLQHDELLVKLSTATTFYSKNAVVPKDDFQKY